MICDICKQKPATVYFTKVINNKKTELNLCQNCASKYNQPSFVIKQNINLPNFMAGLFGQYLPVQTWTVEKKPERCPNCGTEYQEFIKSGLMGCSKCYEQFVAQIDPLLRRIQGSNRHAGKLPKRGGVHLKVKQELETLKNQLQQAISNEEFEKAAQLRDQIKEIENV